jgi:hypothetical protein
MKDGQIVSRQRRGGCKKVRAARKKEKTVSLVRPFQRLGDKPVLFIEKKRFKL